MAIENVVYQSRSLLLGPVYFLPNDLFREVIALNKNPENDRGENKNDDLCNERRKRATLFGV
jgi:hypothetical protein